MWTLYPTVPLTLVTSGSFFLTSELNPLQPIFGIVRIPILGDVKENSSSEVDIDELI